MLTNQVVVTSLIEVGLILFTTYLLILPRALTPEGMSDRLRQSAYYMGVLFLAITFAWSVILGSVLTLHGVVIGGRF